MVSLEIEIYVAWETIQKERKTVHYSLYALLAENYKDEAAKSLKAVAFEKLYSFKSQIIFSQKH